MVGQFQLWQNPEQSSLRPVLTPALSRRLVWVISRGPFQPVRISVPTDQLVDKIREVWDHFLQ